MASYYDYAKLSFRRPRVEEEVDPLSSVANIADAMLVFACGILIALIVAWNVDVNKVVQVEIDRTKQIEDVETLQDVLAGEGDSYIERGTVYQDPNTGKLYMLETGESAGAGASADGSADTGASAGESAAASGSPADGSARE